MRQRHHGSSYRCILVAALSAGCRPFPCRCQPRTVLSCPRCKRRSLDESHGDASFCYRALSADLPENGVVAQCYAVRKQCICALQAQWASLQSTPGSASNIHAGADSCMLLRIIAAAASRFPPEEAASLSRDLLKVCMLFDIAHALLLGPEPLRCLGTSSHFGLPTLCEHVTTFGKDAAHICSAATFRCCFHARR